MFLSLNINEMHQNGLQHVSVVKLYYKITIVNNVYVLGMYVLRLVMNLTGLCVVNVICNSTIKLMTGKALRKHSLHEKTAASVLLKLFISGNE